MSRYNEILKGLNEAIDFEKGNGPACRLLGLLEAKSIPPFVELSK